MLPSPIEFSVCHKLTMLRGTESTGGKRIKATLPSVLMCVEANPPAGIDGTVEYLTVESYRPMRTTTA